MGRPAGLRYQFLRGVGVRVSPKAPKKNKMESALLKNAQLKSRLSEWYQIYKVTGFDGFVELTGYNKSWANIVMLFKRHLPEYVSQKGKPTKFKKRTNPE